MKNPNSYQMHSLPTSTPNRPWPTFSLTPGERRNISSGVLPSISLNPIIQTITQQPFATPAIKGTVYGPEGGNPTILSHVPATPYQPHPVSQQPIVYGAEGSSNLSQVVQPQTTYNYFTPQPKLANSTTNVNSLANWALVLGIASFFFSFLTAVPAFICSYLVLRQKAMPTLARTRAQWSITLAIGLTILGYLVLYHH
jgi:hypothetical protein